MFLLVLAILGGLLFLVGVGPLLFQAGCALASVPDRGYFRALPIYSATLVVCLPLAAVLVWFARRYDADPNDWFGSCRLAAAVGALVLTWLLSAGIYSFFLAASLRKGLLIAALELLLMALLAALAVALTLVVLAIIQINTRPPLQKGEGVRPDLVLFPSGCHDSGRHRYHDFRCGCG